MKLKKKSIKKKKKTSQVVMGQANVPSPNKKTQAHVYFLFLHQERTTNQTNVEE
jgi:hypothetical protein